MTAIKASKLNLDVAEFCGRRKSLERLLVATGGDVWCWRVVEVEVSYEEYW